MRPERFVITDHMSELMEPLLPGSDRDQGVTAKDTRLFMEAILWRVRVGGLGAILLRDLVIGTVFSGGSGGGPRRVFLRVFSIIYQVSQTLNMSSSMEPSSACTKRQAAQKGGSPSGHRPLEGRTDHQGSGSGGWPREPRPFCLLPGQRSEITSVPELINGLSFGALLADKAFDADHLRAELANRGAGAIIPAKRNRKLHIPHDEEVYKWRHMVENYFSKIKEFRAVNTRYDKTDTSYKASCYIAATLIALR